MTPGTGQHHGPVPGYRMGSPRNGMPETLGSGYRFKGMPDWNPAGGVHLDASVVKEEPRQAPEAAARSRAEKLADYTEARDEGFTLAEAAELVGIAESTDYQAAARAGGAS